MATLDWYTGSECNAMKINAPALKVLDAILACENRRKGVPPLRSKDQVENDLVLLAISN